MGHLHRQPIRTWRAKYGLEAMVETGTWQGEGVRAALEAGYPKVVTTDIIPTPQARELERRPNVIAYHYDSKTAMNHMLEDVDELKVLWWLDAHLPERYSLLRHSAPRTPLLAEIQGIVWSDRPYTGDVIVADDMRLYGQPCADGPLPPGISPARPADLMDITCLLEPTHSITFDPRDTGYLVALPK